MEKDAFGKLIRAHRKQRGWNQEELAERWGFTREYVSQIERGKRNPDKQEHILRLAKILGIPWEQLEAVGKVVPPGQKNASSQPGTNDTLLRALLEPAQAAVKMSYLVWQGDNKVVNIGEKLRNWEGHLNEALSIYRGQFRNPALRLLADVHEMRGKLAIERAATKEATHHFQEMYDIAEELNDPELLIIALVHQSEMLRRRNLYEASFRRIAIAEKNAHKYGEKVSKYILGALWKANAISYFNYGDEQEFLRSIGRAEVIADSITTSIDSSNNRFDKIEVLQVKAQGHTQLWQPEKALEIYKETDKLSPSRTIRDQSSYHIIKAQAYCYVGDIATGITYALTGLQMAESLDSIRYVIRLRQMCDRLAATPIGREKVMKELRNEILNVVQRMKS